MPLTIVLDVLIVGATAFSLIGVFVAFFYLLCLALLWLTQEILSSLWGLGFEVHRVPWEWVSEEERVEEGLMLLPVLRRKPPGLSRFLCVTPVAA
jgi:hypothetical protein